MFSIILRRKSMDWFQYDNGPRHERVKINLTGASSGRDYQPLKLPNQLFLTLTHIRAMLHSYRNQSIDLSCKSVDWFLFECNRQI